MPPKDYIGASHRAKLHKMHTWISKFQSTRGYSPSMRELAEAYKTSTSVIRWDLHCMERLGLARLTPQVSRSIVLLPLEEK